MEKGMAEEDARILIDLLSQYKDIFIDTMMVEGNRFSFLSSLL